MIPQYDDIGLIVIATVDGKKYFISQNEEEFILDEKNAYIFNKEEWQLHMELGEKFPKAELEKVFIFKHVG